MNELTSDQSERDRGYIQALLDGDQPSFSPEEKIKVLEILRRVATMCSRRVGPGSEQTDVNRFVFDDSGGYQHLNIFI